MNRFLRALKVAALAAVVVILSACGGGGGGGAASGDAGSGGGGGGGGSSSNVGTLNWKYILGGNAGIPALGSDGTIYLTAGDGYLYAISSNGALKWKYFLTNDVPGTPTVGSDNAIYVSSGFCFFVINPDGTRKWAYSWTAILSDPAIGSDGTIYFGDAGGHLWALNSDATLKWVYHEPYSVYFPDTYPDFSYSPPVVVGDGTIYIGGRDVLAGGLYAINPNGTLKWLRGTFVTTSAAIGSDGTIYYVNRPSGYGVTGADLCAVTSSGTMLWSYSLSMNYFGNPVIGSDGTVYVGGNSDVHALTPNGSLKWKYHTNDLNGGYYPTVGQNGNIFVSEYDSISVLGPDGSVKWTAGSGSSNSSVVIATDGTAYFNGGNTLYAISSGSAGLANSSWPKYRHDDQNTGRE